MNFKNNLFILSVAALTTLSACKKKTNTTTSPAPVADFTYSGADAKAPANVTFTNVSINADKFLWEFGDGDTTSAKNPTHGYINGGTYSVKLTSTGPGGSHSVTKTVTILPAPTTCSIQSISITAMPFADVNGAGWDLLDGPDVCYKISNTSGTVLLDGTTSRFDNASAGSLPLNWTLRTPHAITPINTTRTIQILDYDLLDPNDLIGSVSFNPYMYRGTYPTTLLLTVKDLTVKVNITWQ